jgi:phosphoglycolate phosphatase
MTTERRRLVLFDIDGTILSCGGVPASALGDAMRAVAGAAGPIETFDMSGKTDMQIVRELLVLDGAPAPRIEAQLPEVMERYRRLLEERLRPEHVRAKPGILALVEALHADPAVTLGLLTGNMEPCARIKLAPLGINERFAFGAYGSDNADRYCLAEVAVRRALEHTGRAFSGDDVIVLGDSIHDVLCGRSIGVRAVAVATGRTSREALASAGPDALLDDCGDLRATLAALLG